jgi:hypothetical protein
MIVRKKKELVMAIYNPSMTLTERRIFEFAIYKWQIGDQSFSWKRFLEILELKKYKNQQKN